MQSLIHDNRILAKRGFYCFYARPHVEEVCRRSGTWDVRHIGEKIILLLDYRIIQKYLVY